MQKLIVSCLLFFVCSMGYAKSISLEMPDQPIPLNVDVSEIADFNIFEAADRVLHFTSQRVLHFANGELYICPHNAEIFGNGDNRKCTTDALKTAWVPLLVLNVYGFEITGVRFTFTKANDVGLLVYFRKIQNR